MARYAVLRPTGAAQSTSRRGISARRGPGAGVRIDDDGWQVLQVERQDAVQVRDDDIGLFRQSHARRSNRSWMNSIRSA